MQAVFKRFFPGRPLKSLNEMPDIPEAAGICNVEHRNIRSPEHLHSVPNAYIIDIIYACSA